MSNNEYLDIGNYIETLDKDWDRDKDLRDKFENIKRDYVREKIEEKYKELDIKMLFEIQCFGELKDYKLFLEWFRDERVLTFEEDEVLDHVEGYINDKIFDNGLVWFADKVKEFEEDWSLEEVENENKGQ